MKDLNDNEKFIIEKLKENDNKMSYKTLQAACEDKFEGLRLILKKLKEAGIVDFEGLMPTFSSEITITDITIDQVINVYKMDISIFKIFKKTKKT